METTEFVDINIKSEELEDAEEEDQDQFAHLELSLKTEKGDSDEEKVTDRFECILSD